MKREDVADFESHPVWAEMKQRLMDERDALVHLLFNGKKEESYEEIKAIRLSIKRISKILAFPDQLREEIDQEKETDNG